MLELLQKRVDIDPIFTKYNTLIVGVPGNNLQVYSKGKDNLYILVGVSNLNQMNFDELFAGVLHELGHIEGQNTYIDESKINQLCIENGHKVKYFMAGKVVRDIYVELKADMFAVNKYDPEIFCSFLEKLHATVDNEYGKKEIELRMEYIIKSC